MTNNIPASIPPDQAGEEDETEHLSSHLKALADEQFRRYMRQASLLLSSGNGKDAIPLLERCLEIHPHDINVLTNLGGAYILAERHKRAIPLLEKAALLVPNNPAIWTNLAAAYLGKLITATEERQQRALTAYRQVLLLDPAYPNVHYNMGLIFIDQRNWPEADAAFTQALHVNPHDEDALHMRRRVREIMTGADPDPADPRAETGE